jgi:hypothetical protein
MKRQLTIGLVYCFVSVLGVAVSACTRQEAPDISGVYALVSVDGKTMPATLSHQGVSLQVRSGTFTINADGTCASKTVFAPSSGPEVEREVAATYTKDGSTLTMQWEGAGSTSGTLDGDTFTMDNEGIVFVYKK